jgi:hypothetical protein
LIARPNQRAWKLVAVVVSMVTLFCMLSGAAVAQGITEVPLEDIQSANQYIDDLSTTGLTLQAESEPVAGGAVTAKLGESPWLVDQQRFDPEDTPAQIANEVEQPSEANQPLMKSDLSTIAPVQESSPPTAAESATIEPVTEVPVISSSTPEEPVASNASSTTSEPVASDPIDSIWRFKPPLGIYERQLLGLSILVLSFVLPGLIVSWKLSHARVSILGTIRGESKRTHHTRAAEPKSSMLRAEWTTEVSRRCRRHCVKHAPRRRDHRSHQGL